MWNLGASNGKKNICTDNSLEKQVSTFSDFLFYNDLRSSYAVKIHSSFSSLFSSEEYGSVTFPNIHYNVERFG